MIADLLDRQLSAIAPPNRPRTIRLSCDGVTLECAVRHVDSIGCALDHVAVEFPDAGARPTADIEAISARLCQDLRYLLEPLQILEIDRQEHQCQARSQPPSRQPAGSSYYELLVGGHRLSLYRYHAPQGQARTAIPINLTRETLGRLADDLVAATQRA